MNTLADVSFSDSLQETLDGIGNFIPNLIGAIAILLIGWFIAKVIFRVVTSGDAAIGYALHDDRRCFLPMAPVGAEPVHGTKV